MESEPERVAEQSKLGRLKDGHTDIINDGEDAWRSSIHRADRKTYEQRHDSLHDLETNTLG